MWDILKIFAWDKEIIMKYKIHYTHNIHFPIHMVKIFKIGFWISKIILCLSLKQDAHGSDVGHSLANLALYKKH